MYVEMKSEFEQLAQELTVEQLEVVASQVLAGLEKMAEEEELAKVADISAGDVLGGAALGAAAIGGGVMLGRKLPGLKQDFYKSREAVHTNRAVRSFNAAEEAKAKAAGVEGLGAAPAIPAVENPVNPTKSNYNQEKNKTPLERINAQNTDGSIRNSGAIQSDVTKLTQADWVHKNKDKIALGLGAGAVVGGLGMQNQKQQSELRGAYGVGRR